MTKDIIAHTLDKQYLKQRINEIIQLEIFSGPIYETIITIHLSPRFLANPREYTMERKQRYGANTHDFSIRIIYDLNERTTFYFNKNGKYMGDDEMSRFERSGY